jgi:hypothetical protein
MPKRRMYANDVPVQLAPSYIPLKIAEGTAIAEPDPGAGGIISRFAELGYAQVRITELSGSGGRPKKNSSSSGWRKASQSWRSGMSAGPLTRSP